MEWERVLYICSVIKSPSDLFLFLQVICFRIISSWGKGEEIWYFIHSGAKNSTQNILLTWIWWVIFIATGLKRKKKKKHNTWQNLSIGWMWSIYGFCCFVFGLLWFFIVIFSGGGLIFLFYFCLSWGGGGGVLCTKI